MKLTLTLLIMMLWITAAEARICKSSGGGEYESYRLVDGRKCWFAGTRRPNKTELHWEQYGVAVRHKKPTPDVKPGAVRWPGISTPLLSLPDGPGSFNLRWSEEMDLLIGNPMEEYRER